MHLFNLRALCVLCGLFLAPAWARGHELDVLPAEIDDGPKSGMFHRWLMRMANEALDRRDAEYEKLKTPEDITAWQHRMKDVFRRELGEFPHRSPLHAQVTGHETRDGYKIEKLVFESQPRHYVTAILYLPEAKPPYPGVLVPCGHSGEGKAYDSYQRMSILLAKNGIAALCFDPIGQGERLQILLDDKPNGIGSTVEHTLIDVSCIPLGTNTARYMIWDGIRALDYLTGRLDIDATRLGCAGNSGGGTQTAYLMALDPRIACAAPSCYITSMRKLLATIGPQDGEQNIHAQISEGMTHSEYVLMRAPSPTLICAATHDFFNIDGAWDTFRDAKRLYARFGVPERASLIETDAKHGYNAQLREATTAWMRRWLLKIDAPVTESDFAVAKPADIQCTETGQVMDIGGARSVFDLNVDWEDRLAKKRTELWGKGDKAALLDQIRKLAGVRPLADLPDCEVETVSVESRPGYELRRLVLTPEEGVMLPALAMVPTERRGPVVLYVDGAGKQEAAAEGGELDHLARSGTLVVAIDLRGLGETADGAKPDGIGAQVGDGWKNWMIAYMLNRSFTGMWAEDILVTTRWLTKYEAAIDGDSAKPNQVRVIGVGNVGPALLHATALERDLFARVEVRKSLRSWAEVVRSKETKQQLPTLVHGALEVYDLPDLVKLLSISKLDVVDPVDARGQPLDARGEPIATPKE
jgi:cephalosporin-C deacetylase-like acetyl esterase